MQDRKIQDRYLKEHFDRKSSFDFEMSDSERRRIAATTDIVPLEWGSIIDVGCGDGRATSGLLDRPVNLSGIDWASKRLARFQGKAIAADIRSTWPVDVIFDGAVLAEVLEHLTLVDVRSVLNNTMRFVRYGFVVSVPAHESLESNMTTCRACKQDYHIWGHQHSFQSFEDVDSLVGNISVVRRFVQAKSRPRSRYIARIKKSLGYYPYEPDLLCPFCGAEQWPSSVSGLPSNLLNKVLSVMELVSSFQRPIPGWFICRYDVD